MSCYCETRSIFKATYQDKALNTRIELIACGGWGDAVPMAYSCKKAEEKLLMIEYMGESLPS